jgi:hypothetical protein
MIIYIDENIPPFLAEGLNILQKPLNLALREVIDVRSLTDNLMLKPPFSCKFVIFFNYSFIFATNSTLTMQNLYQINYRNTTTMMMTPWGVI